MPHSHVAGTAAFSGSSPITANPPGGAGSDQTGKLLLFISQTTSNGAAVTTPPTGYTRIEGLTELAAFYKHGSASEPAVSVSYAGSAAGGAQITAFTSSTGAWAPGASVLAGFAERSPANGNDLPYAAMAKVADGNLRVCVAGKNGTTVGIDITSVAVTPGYTQCAFVKNDQAAGGMCMAAEYQDVSANAVDTDAVITTWAVSRPRRGVTIEFVPAASTPVLTLSDSTLELGDAGLPVPQAPGQVSGTISPALAGAVNGATISGPSIPAVDVSAYLANATSGSFDLVGFDTALLRVGQIANKLPIRTSLTLSVTDGVQTVTATIQLEAAKPTQANIVSSLGSNAPAGLLVGEMRLCWWTSGYGSFLPETGAASATVFEDGIASYVEGGYDESAFAWIEGTAVTFEDAASGPSVTATDGTVQIGEAGLTHAPVAAGTEVYTATGLTGNIVKAWIL